MSPFQKILKINLENGFKNIWVINNFVYKYQKKNRFCQTKQVWREFGEYNKKKIVLSSTQHNSQSTLYFSIVYFNCSTV